MKTLKTEEVGSRTFCDLADATATLGSLVNDVYNTQRLHSALDYL
jgi:putative transposase